MNKRDLLSLTLLAPILLVVLLVAAACSDLEPLDETSTPAPSTPAASTPAPTQSAAPTPAAAPSGEAIDANGLLLTLPDGWQQVAPDSSMRLFQASIPGSAGEARLAAFHFGAGGGGGVDANLNRWIGQMADPTEPARQGFDANGLAVTWVEVGGTLKKSQIGSFPTADMPGYALIGAVVEGAGGPWYLRLVGPAATVREQAAAFRSMLEAAQLAG